MPDLTIDRDAIDPRILDLMKAQREAILAVCERFGYGATIVIAARAWAEKPPMNRKGMAEWMRYAADELAGWKIGRLERVRDNLKMQAKIWAQEARTQQGIVLGILRALGLPLRDYNAESSVSNYVAKLRTDLTDTLAILRACTPAVFCWNEYELYKRVHDHLERLDPQPPDEDGPGSSHGDQERDHPRPDRRAAAARLDMGDDGRRQDPDRQLRSSQCRRTSVRHRPRAQ